MEEETHAYNINCFPVGIIISVGVNICSRLPLGKQNKKDCHTKKTQARWLRANIILCSV